MIFANDLVSTTVEDAFLELATCVQLAEQSTVANPSGVSNIQITYDTDAKAVGVTFAGEQEMSIDPATGKTQFSVKEYLNDA